MPSTFVINPPTLAPAASVAAMGGSSLLWIAGPTELQVHAKTISTAPTPVFHPIVSPSSTVANAVPQIGSVDKITSDSAAGTFSMASICKNTVVEVVMSATQRSAKGTTNDPEDSKIVSCRSLKDGEIPPAMAHQPIARVATASRCAATIPSVLPGYL